MLNDIHGKGHFTLTAFLIILAGLNATGFWFYILSYLIMLPKYKDCVFTDPQPSDPVKECNSDNVCDSSVVISY